MSRRRKNKNQKYGGYVMIPREFLLALKDGHFKNLTEFGAYVAMLLGARFDYRDEQNRYYTSDIKMVEKAGLDRTTWYRHRMALEESGMIRGFAEEDCESEFPVWTEWYENFNDGAFVQQHEERLQQYAANAQPKRVHLNFDRPTSKQHSTELSGLVKGQKRSGDADMQHPETSLETTVDTPKREPLKNRSIAPTGRQSTMSKVCEKCGARVEGAQIMWSQLKTQKNLCGNCFPSLIGNGGKLSPPPSNPL